LTEAGLRADVFGQVGEKGDDVVLRLPLDGVDPLHLERAQPADVAGGLVGDHPQLGLRVAGMCLNVQPDAETRFGLPDRRHLRPAVARDHLRMHSVVERGSSRCDSGAEMSTDLPPP